MSTNPRSTNIWGKPLILTETKTNSKKVKLGGIIDYTGRNKTKQTNKTPKNLLDICPGRFIQSMLSSENANSNKWFPQTPIAKRKLFYHFLISLIISLIPLCSFSCFSTLSSLGGFWEYVYFTPIYDKMHMIAHRSPGWSYSQASLSSHDRGATSLEQLENKINGLSSSGMRFRNLCGGKINR